ncbi:hypothetical protein [Methylobacterium nodulans]|uniref:Uncharacterized protein n=1 Tax=Methylobacterium nodulans (strain LMG 21967 / CNCM I-2342 / ORS 2060) TaxID=460265 RepID=B8IMP8_METNO|nr:hypothetical protein [Methylobacterium nodulans]ACL60241.1 hypothetical protein Mnod_5396 [Methylobacterium nodulans ORS 2060]
METAHGASPNDGVRLHEFTRSEKNEIQARLFTEWAAHLSTAETTLIGWLLANTVARGHRSGTYSLNQLINGVPKRDGSGMWTAGTGMSLNTIRRAIEAARSRGLIHTSQCERGTIFTVVLTWNPKTGKAEESNVVALNLPRARRANLTVVPNEQTAPDADAGEWGVPNSDKGGCLNLIEGGIRFGHPSIEKPTNQETISREDPAPPCGPRSLLPEVRKRTRPVPAQTPSVSVPETVQPSPRCAAPPPTAQAAIDRAAEARKARLAAARKRVDTHAWRTTWEAAYSECYPARTIAMWTDRETGILKKAVNRHWPANRLSEVHNFLDWVVRNWDPIRKAKLGWMEKDPPPSQPQIGFVARLFPKFHEAYSDQAELKWRGTLPGTKQKVIALMRDKGLTEEVAFRQVLARQEAERNEERMRKLAAQAKRDREVAMLAAATARRETRFTKENPHPRAHENKPKPVEMVPGEPDWENGFKLPEFDESKW